MKTISFLILALISFEMASQNLNSVYVTITADNAYVFGFGDKNGLYPGMLSNPVVNCTNGHIYSSWGPEQPPYEIQGINLVNTYVYICAWSDRSGYQGLLAEITSGPVTILTGQNLPSNIDWEVFSTGINVYQAANPNSNNPTGPCYPEMGPLESDVNAQIALANSDAGDPNTTSIGWVKTSPVPGKKGVLAFGPYNLSSPPFPPHQVMLINQNAKWMWYNPDETWSTIVNPFASTPPIPNPNPPNGIPMNMQVEYLIFRLGPIDSLLQVMLSVGHCCDTINTSIDALTQSIDNNGYGTLDLKIRSGPELIREVDIQILSAKRTKHFKNLNTNVTTHSGPHNIPVEVINAPPVIGPSNSLVRQPFLPFAREVVWSNNTSVDMSTQVIIPSVFIKFPPSLGNTAIFDRWDEIEVCYRVIFHTDNCVVCFKDQCITTVRPAYGPGMQKNKPPEQQEENVPRKQPDVDRE